MNTSWSARDIAVRSLRDRGGNVTAHLNRLLGDSPLSRSDKALGRKLAMGVIRRRDTLDAILRAYLKHPGKKLPGAVREILYVALYQILCLDRIPDFAVVDEAVEQTARLHHKRQSGLVNGILRTILRELPEKQKDSPSPAPAADVIPMCLNNSRRVGRAVLPDPDTAMLEYLASAYSLPLVLARRWIEGFGEEEARRLGGRSCLHPPLIVRVNRLRSTLDQVLQSLTQSGATALCHENGCSVVLELAKDLTQLPAFRDGLIQPQDPTATAVAEIAAVQPGMRVLDFCAAPGTKTTHMGELMDNRGSITAVDVSPEKLEKIEQNCRRLGVEIVSTRLASDVGQLEPRSFDVVLVDAPCSNTGVLGRRPEARWRFSGENLTGLVEDQKALLTMAGEFVAPPGRLVYSTCSIEPEECGQIAHWFTKRPGHFGLSDEILTLPGGGESPEHWHDGGYVAIFNSS